ncbi:hypothetical protein C1M56_14950 [Vibrio diazotrophicus]|nr:hypothetical protein C1M56_14950 [Vibrio diazotrophicus]
MIQKIKILYLLILLGLLLAPVTFYTFQFGVGIWQEHDDWAAMGSAFGGMYSPIIALLAFIVLATQVHAQLRSEVHNVDMLFIQGCKDDIEFSINRLELELSERNNAQDECISSHLLNIREKYENNEINDLKAQELWSDFNLLYPKILPLWCSVNSTLVGLSNSDKFPYNHNLMASLLKANGALSPKICSSLDMLLYFTVGSSNKFYFWEKR